MDYDQTSDKISDIDFSPITIGKHNCNVNRKGDEMIFLTDFSDVIPIYDKSKNPFMEIKSKKTGDVTLVRLNDYAANRMIFPHAGSMSNEEFFSKFVEYKKPVVENLISRTFAKGFETPSPVQALTIPELIQGKDALVQFKSGTGKTHAFLFGCLWAFDPYDKNLQHIFITSSHEVAVQIYDQVKFLLPTEKNITLCIGQGQRKEGSGGFKSPIGTSGLSRPKTIREEKEEVQNAKIIVGTMGKIYDYMCNKKWINCGYLKTICVDEFDNIVVSRSKSKTSAVMSTEDQIKAVINMINICTQRIFISATVSQQSLEIAHSYFRQYSPAIGEPFIVLLDIDNYTLEEILQYYVKCISTEEKVCVLKDLLGQCRITQSIVFVNRIETAEKITAEIEKFYKKNKIEAIIKKFHAEMSSEERKLVHQDFVQGKVRLLISTDVTARGLDVQGVNLVINFDMPNVLETYIHRVGRSGRYGRKGVAISLILEGEMRKITEINECSKQSEMTPLPEDLANLL